MIDNIPEEDRALRSDRSTIVCTHKWINLDCANGFSRITPDEYIVIFFCEHCLSIRKKALNISDQAIPMDVRDLYEGEE